MQQQMEIPFFNYQALFKRDKENLLTVIEDVCSRGAYILQRDVTDFERNIAEFLNVKYAIGVANGTDALIIALRAAGIKPGDEVILPTHTYIATAASVHLTGGVPVLVESGPDHMVDPAAMRKAVTPKTRFLMPVHVNGRTCNMDAIMAIAKDHNLTVIEDAAQALGSKFKGRAAGTFGAAGMFSLYPAKVLGCFGDGGLLVTNDDKMAKQMLLLRDHGRNEEGRVVTWGFNSRLDNLQAAILNFKFKTYPQELQRRRDIAALYEKNLSGIAEITLPPGPNDSPDHYDIYQNYEIEADRRDELKTFLKANGVGTIVQWAGTLVHQFQELGFKQSLPVTEKMNSRFLMLPMHTALSDQEVLYVCEQIRKFYRK